MSENETDESVNEENLEATEAEAAEEEAAAEEVAEEAPAAPAELSAEDEAKLAELDADLEKYTSAKRWSDVIKTLVAKAEIHVDPSEKVALYREAGTLYIERSSNQAEAIKCFENVLEFEPNDIEAITRLKEMYEKRRDWDGLISMMNKEVELADPDERAFRLVEIAELGTKRIRKPDICIGLWENVLAVEPTHPKALEEIAPLYERARQWEPLAGVLEQLTEADPDPKQLQKLGMLYADKLEDDEGAVRAFRKLLTVNPDDRRATEQLKRRYVALKAWDELEEFFGANEMWDDLIRIFEKAADDKEATSEERIELLFRAAKLWEDEKQKADRAARALEKVLDTDETNLPAAEALSRIYEESGDARKLVRVYEVRLVHDMEREAKVALLRECATLYEEKLRNPKDAYQRHLDAFAAMPEAEIVREDVERLAEATRDWDSAIAAYNSAIEGALEDDAIELRLNLGRILQRVEKIEDAIASYRAIYEVRDDHPEAIAALRELYGATEKFEELLGILDRQLELETDIEVRRGLAYERAQLFVERLSDSSRAIEAYVDILAEYGDDEAAAFLALDSLYEQEERWEDLADTLQRRIDLGPETEEEIASLKFRLGRVREQRLGAKHEAVELYREVLMLMPDHDGAREALEALLEDEEVATPAARILEPLYEERMDWDSLVRALRVLHSGSLDEDERLELLTKIGEVHGVRREDPEQSFGAFAEALGEQPGHGETLERLENLALTHEKWPQLVELLAGLAAAQDDPSLARSLWVKCAEINVAQLGDVDAAVGAYRKCLDLDPGDLDILLSLEGLFRARERWPDLVDVLRRRVEASSDPGEQEHLLSQIAQIQDEFLEDPTSAIATQREILELDPASRGALSALDQLLARQELWADLADNVDRQLEIAEEPEEQIALMLHLAELREHRMSNADAAIEIYREVLEREPTNETALTNLERLLEEPAYQILIAEILEPLYRDMGEVAKLIGVHEIQANHASAPERRVELLHRIGELAETMQGDLASAFTAYARALAEDPMNEETQGQLERLAPALGDMDALARVYEERAQAHMEAEEERPSIAAPLLMKAANLREIELDEAGVAVGHYRKVLELDPQELEAAASLERIFTMTDQPEELASILLDKAKMLDLPEEQLEHLHRAAAVYEEHLGRPQDAIKVHHQALEVDEEDLHSIDKLIELNLRLEQWQDLLAVYEKKADIIVDPKEKKRLFVEVGTVYENELGDLPKAIDSYEQMLEVDPEDLMALQRLDALYAATEQWQELRSVLEREADLAPDELEAISYRYRIADLWHRRLDDADRAIEIYREILDVQMDHQPTRDALEAMIAENTSALQAAQVLDPIYRAEGEAGRLAAVLEVQVAHEEDDLQAVDFLHQLAELYEVSLEQAPQAFDAFLRALPKDNRSEHTLAGIERLADVTGQWAEVVKHYDREVAKLSVEAPDDMVELGIRVAQLYEVQIGDVDTAIQRYSKVLEIDDINPSAIAALDRLYEATARWAELAQVLEREVQTTSAPDEMLGFQYRLGKVHEQHLGDVSRAIGLYEEILQSDPEHANARLALETLVSNGSEPGRIMEILDPLYRDGEQWDRLLALTETQLHYVGEQDARVQTMHRIAEIAEELAYDSEHAFLWMQKALLEDPNHDHSLGESERLGGMLGNWEQLADTYASAIERSQGERKLLLAQRLARVYEEEIGDVVQAESAYRFVLSVDPKDRDALEALDRLYAENGAAQSLAATLRMRIAASEESHELVELHHRLGAVLEDQLGRTDEAIAAYERILDDYEPEYAEAVEALQVIHTRRADWPALYGALERELNVAFGDGPQSDVLAKMARLAESQLADPERAVELWRRVLELRGEDPEALNALGNLYGSLERWTELAEVLDREVSVVDDDAHKIAVYADLARLFIDKLERPHSALENWERVLDLDPHNTDALFQMAEIHRRADAHHDLVDTLLRVVDAGAATLEDAQLEAVYMQLGHLYAVDLEQPMDAIEIYNRAVELNPANFGALDALEHLHRSEEMWREAIDVMESRVTVLATPDEQIQQLLTIAQTWADQMQDKDGGTSAYQRILERDVLHEYAFQQLEVLHREAGRSEDLVDLFVNRVENLEDMDESVRLLLKTASVYEKQLEDPEQAYDALTLAWQVDFTDEEVARELERVTGLANKWNDLLALANEALQQEEDPNGKIALCLQCARWYGFELGHPEYAVHYYEQVMQIDPRNVPALRQMAELYERTQQWEPFFQTLGQVVAVSSDPDDQAESYVKMGEVAMTHLGAVNEAPGYFTKAFELGPNNVRALESLEKIYAQQGQWPLYIEMLERKVRALPEQTEEKQAARLQLAEAYEDRSQDVESAVEMYRAVTTDDEFNLPALKGLERLYARSSSWTELLKVLETQYEVVQTEKERITILLQLAGMWEEEFVKPEKAAERLEQVVEIDYTHAGALGGLARLYRQLQQWDKVIETYERHIAATPDRGEKIRLYKALGATYVHDLKDQDRGVDAYLEVLAIDDHETEALNELTKLYEKRQDFAGALEMMEKLAILVDDPAQQVDLLYRTGRILDQELGDRVEALDKYQRALDLEPSHLPSLSAMRAIQLDSGDWLAAAKLLEQEATYTENQRVVAELLVELGKLYDEQLDEPDRALETWEAAYRQDGDNEDAAMPLAGRYVKAERYEEAAPLLEMLVKRMGKREPEQQLELSLEFGAVSTKLGKHSDAISAFERAIGVDAHNLQALMGLANAHYAAEDWGNAFKHYQTLLVHHREELAPDEVVDTFFRLGVIKREQGDRRKAQNMFDKALEEDPQHRPTLEAVVGLYQNIGDWQQVIHFKKRVLDVVDDIEERFNMLDAIGGLWKEKLSNSQKAIEAYREASDIKPDDHRMLHKLLVEYQETKQWEQAIEIIEAIATLDDRKLAKAKYAYTIGVIYRDELKDLEMSLQKFNQALDLDPDQLKPFEAINKLLNQKKDWKALERAYRKMIHRIIQEPGRDDLKHNLFYTLGIIYRDRQRNFDAAAESFKTALAMKPDDPQQHQILAELYATMPERVNEAIEEHQWLLQHDPERVESYRALYKLYFDARTYDKAWCVASTLTALGKADQEQQGFFQQYKPQGPPRPRGRVDRQLWFNDLLHPDEDRYVSKIMEIMAPALLQVKTQSDKQIGLNKLKPVDPAQSRVTFAQAFGHAFNVLGIPTIPRLYIQQQQPGGLSGVDGSNPPAALAGSTFLQGYMPNDLMFVAGRFATYYLSEHFVRTILKSHTELKMMLLAALRIAGQGPADPSVDQWAQQLLPHLNPTQQDALRQVCRRFIEAGGSTDIKRWMMAVELSACRAGFVVAGDLEAARKMLPALGAAGSVDHAPKDKFKDLVLFSVSEQYFRLRERLGIQIQV